MKTSLRLVPLLLGLCVGAFAGEVEKGPAAPSSVPAIAAPVAPVPMSGLDGGIAGPAITGAAGLDEARSVEAGAASAAAPADAAVSGQVEAISAGAVESTHSRSRGSQASAQPSAEAADEAAAAEGRVIFDQAGRRDGDDGVPAALVQDGGRANGLSPRHGVERPSAADPAAASAPSQVLAPAQGKKAGPTTGRALFAAFNGLLAAVVVPAQISAATPGQFSAAGLALFSALFGLGAFAVVRGGLKTGGRLAAGFLAGAFPAAVGALVFQKTLELGGATVAAQSVNLAAFVGAAAGAAAFSATLGSAFSDRLAKSGLSLLKPSALDRLLILSQLAAYNVAAVVLILSSPLESFHAALSLHTAGFQTMLLGIGYGLAGFLILALYAPVTMAGALVTVELAAGLRWMNAGLGRLKSSLSKALGR